EEMRYQRGKELASGHTAIQMGLEFMQASWLQTLYLDKWGPQGVTHVCSTHFAGPVEWETREDEPIKKKSDGPDNIIKRIFNILKFTWVLFLATVDSFTTWLNSISREHIDISTVLRIERCMLTREIKKGNVPTRESIHMYYQNHIMNLSRESGLDTIDDRPGTASGAQTAHRMDSLDSHDSISRYFTF
uniref:piezo-type mechanosensitive ion channel component 2-like n=1 Tax=Panthera onca TaxID=9690 RepID=UPI002955617E